MYNVDSKDGQKGAFLRLPFFCCAPYSGFYLCGVSIVLTRMDLSHQHIDSLL